MNKPYAIKIHPVGDAVRTGQTVAIRSGENPPVVIEVNGHANVELTDTSTGIAPQKVSVRRVGIDLQVSFEGADPGPDLILQGFYDESDNHLVGLAESGQYFEYIPASGDGVFYVPLLTEGAEGIQLLGGEALAGAGWSPLAEAVTATSSWETQYIGWGAVAVVAALLGKDRTSIPATPTVRPAGYDDNVGPMHNASSTALLTDDSTPGLRTGALPPGARGAVLYVDGVAVPATFDHGSGTLTPLASLSDGTHTLGYGLSNEGGSTPSGPSMTVTVDTTAPTAPTLVVRDADGNGRPDISGTAEPGGQVTITDPAGGTYTVTADGSGNYSLDIAAPSPLTGEYKAVVMDPAGNSSPQTITDVTDLTAPMAPSLVVRDADGDLLPDISGTAEAGSKVTITDPAGVIHTTTADSSGNYKLEIAAPNPLTGDYKATATDLSNNVSLATTTKVTDLTSPPAPKLVVRDTDGDLLPNISGTAEAGSKVTITDPAGVIHTVVADGSGNYSLEIPAPSPLTGDYKATATDDAGNVSPVMPYKIRATATDSAGLTGAATTALLLTVDTTRPDAPSVPDLAVADDTGASGSDNITSQTTGLTFTGTAEAGATVVLFKDMDSDGVVDTGESLGTTTATGGNWSIDASLAGSAMPYKIRATATDSAGLTGAATTASGPSS